jgi:hypothetical protein
MDVHHPVDAGEVVAPDTFERWSRLKAAGLSASA